MLGPIPTLFVQRNSGNDQEVYWEQPKLSVGRDSANDIVIEHRLASRRHATFEQDDVGFYIRDLESTNGTFVNGKRVDRARLASGDRLQVGRVELIATKAV